MKRRKDSKWSDDRLGNERKLPSALQFWRLRNLRTKWQLTTQKIRPNFLDRNLKVSLLLSEMFECYKVDLLSLEKNSGPPEVVGQKRKGKTIASLPVVSRKKNSSVSGTSSTKHDLTITENEDTETEGNVTEVPPT